MVQELVPLGTGTYRYQTKSGYSINMVRSRAIERRPSRAARHHSSARARLCRRRCLASIAACPCSTESAALPTLPQTVHPPSPTSSATAAVFSPQRILGAHKAPSGISSAPSTLLHRAPSGISSSPSSAPHKRVISNFPISPVAGGKDCGADDRFSDERGVDEILQ